MLKYLLFFCSFTGIVFAQDDENFSTDSKTLPQEIGLDGFFSTGTFGGTFALGLKYGFKFGEEKNFIAGPALRIQRSWSNNLGQKFAFNILGLGAFFHARFYNALFLGTELEFLNSPIQYNILTPPKQFVPVLFAGGGYSQEFDTGFRINVGIFYDLINNLNSPYRLFYTAKKENGVIIPVLYRLALFIPITPKQ
jgi:hypothetical protein